MEMNDFFAELDAVFIHDFPGVNREYLENGFLKALRKGVNEHGLRVYLMKPDGSIDLDWVSFLWWVFKSDSARINDALHGCIWTPEGEIKPLNEESSLFNLIEKDPIVRAERIKTKDYIKHINWVFHKTQNLPNIVVIGRDNIPARLHGLRNSKLTLLDPKNILPKEKLFPDFMQRRRFHVVDSYDIFDVTNTTESRLVESQNVFIIDNYRISFDSYELEQKILLAGILLTEHGRCLFDLPMYGDAIDRSKLFGIVQSFTNGPTKHISPNATAIDRYVHEIVSKVNSDIPKWEGKNYRFEIEDMKLTDVGLSQSVALRVYLKKTSKN